jgi:hypothetical protein
VKVERGFYVKWDDAVKPVAYYGNRHDKKMPEGYKFLPSSDSAECDLARELMDWYTETPKTRAYDPATRSVRPMNAAEHEAEDDFRVERSMKGHVFEAFFEEMEKTKPGFRDSVKENAKARRRNDRSKPSNKGRSSR